MRWLDGNTDQWTWVWVNSGSWLLTGRPGVLQSIGSQRVRDDWVTELKPARLISVVEYFRFKKVKISTSYSKSLEIWKPGISVQNWSGYHMYKMILFLHIFWYIYASRTLIWISPVIWINRSVLYQCAL